MANILELQAFGGDPSETEALAKSTESYAWCGSDGDESSHSYVACTRLIGV